MILRTWNARQRTRVSHVLLYHSTFSRIPDNLKQGLHNVAPDVLRKQLLWLKQYFDSVTIDDFISEWKPGRFAVTFDDAYQSVFDEATEVLEDLKIPATVFVNGCALEGKPFWRDQIRFLINRGWVAEFLNVLNKRSPDMAALLTPENFYIITKSRQINSRIIAGFVADFLAAKKVPDSDFTFCLCDPACIRRSPFITLGSHSRHHYVLSSLTDDEQEEEIRTNEAILDRLEFPRSKVFSIPFGSEAEFNAATMRIIRRCGYRGFLYCRNRLNDRILTSVVDGAALPAVDRYMAADSFRGFQRHVFRLSIKAIHSRVRHNLL